MKYMYRYILSFREVDEMTDKTHFYSLNMWLGNSLDWDYEHKYALSEALTTD